MGRFYGVRILSGDLTIDDVPRLWRKTTQDWLNKNGTTPKLS